MSDLRAAAAAIRADITRGRWLGYEWTMGSVARLMDIVAEDIEYDDSLTYKTPVTEVARAYLSEAG